MSLTNSIDYPKATKIYKNYYQTLPHISFDVETLEVIEMNSNFVITYDYHFRRKFTLHDLFPLIDMTEVYHQLFATKTNINLKAKLIGGKAKLQNVLFNSSIINGKLHLIFQ